MNIGTRIMAHRYLYYVLGRPVISDYEYDQMEKSRAKSLPEDHSVHRPGSDRLSDYSPEVREAAMDLLEGRQA